MRLNFNVYIKKRSISGDISALGILYSGKDDYVQTSSPSSSESDWATWRQYPHSQDDELACLLYLINSFNPMRGLAEINSDALIALASVVKVGRRIAIMNNEWI